MGKVILRDRRKIPPFNEPARELSVLTKPLWLHQRDVLARYTTEEHEVDSLNVATAAAVTRLSTGEAMREIFASRAFIYILIASSVVAFLGYGKALWTISFFIRSHGLSTTEAGLSMAVVLGLAGVFGTWLGGKMADRFGARSGLIGGGIATAVWTGVAVLLYLRARRSPDTDDAQGPPVVTELDVVTGPVELR